jgi:hypothetical protein
VSYTVLGDPTAKAFGIFAALGTVAFAFGDTILPEIQASSRHSMLARTLRLTCLRLWSGHLGI